MGPRVVALLCRSVSIMTGYPSKKLGRALWGEPVWLAVASAQAKPCM